jgi:heme-degrading monooxygenase HmoA
MIARMWHGRTLIAKADTYAALMNRLAIPDYRAIPGNLAVHILRRDDGEVAHFITFTLWESLAAIEKFAGTPVDQAKYYPEDRDFLLEFELQVLHWEVAGTASSK